MKMFLWFNFFARSWNKYIWILAVLKYITIFPNSTDTILNYKKGIDIDSHGS